MVQEGGHFRENKQFVPFGEYQDLNSLYIAVTTLLREIRQLKEKEKKGTDRNSEEDDSKVMRIGESPEREYVAFLHDKETRVTQPLPPDLEPLPELQSPCGSALSPMRVAESVSGALCKLYERFLSSHRSVSESLQWSNFDRAEEIIVKLVLFVSEHR